MALHLNLFHEHEAARRARQRDPVKLAILVGLVLAMAMGAFYMVRAQQVRSMTAEQTRLQSDWNRLEPRLAQAEEEIEDYRSLIESSTTLVGLVEGRVLWGPVLEVILKTVPANVQLTRLRGSLLEGRRTVSVTLEGISAGSEPREVAETLRRQLIRRFAENYEHADASFRSLEDSSARVTMEGQPFATARFDIDLRFELPDPQAEDEEEEEV